MQLKVKNGFINLVSNGITFCLVIQFIASFQYLLESRYIHVRVCTSVKPLFPSLTK